MPGIYIAATVGTLAAVGGWGYLFFRRAPSTVRPLIPILFCLQLPMSWLTYVVVRVSPKYVARYVAEQLYRFNRRWWRDQLQTRLITACLVMSPVAYADVTR